MYDDGVKKCCICGREFNSRLPQTVIDDNNFIEKIYKKVIDNNVP